MTQEMTEYFEQLEEKEDYLTLINEIKKALAENIRSFSNPFINEGVKDKVALKAATRLIGDKRSDKQKIAEQYLKGEELREWSVDMPSAVCPHKYTNTTLLFVPGLLNGMLPVRAFQTPFPIVEKKLGIRILRSDIHPMRGCDPNIQDIVDSIETGKGLTADCKIIPENEQVPPGDFFLMGYSKGTPDILEFLVKRPEYKKRVKCIFNWAGAIGGSYLADDIHETIKNLSIPKAEGAINSILSLISPVVSPKGAFRRFDEIDTKGAVYDLTTMARSKFLEDNAEELNDLDIPIFNISGSTTAMEVPLFQVQGFLQLNKYDGNNDMQLIQSQAKVTTPMATDLAMVHAHHWDMSYDTFPQIMRFGTPNLDHPFPKEAAATAIVQLAAELGFAD